MMTSTKRAFWSCALLAILTMPLEIASFSLLKRGHRLSVPEAWVRRMSPQERREAAGRIDQYPVAYRKALLAGLNPSEQATVWHQQTVGYLDRHPNLTISQRAAVQALLQYTTSDAFERPAAYASARATAAKLVLAELGGAAYDELFLRTSTATEWSSPLPVRVALEAAVNRQFVAHANPNCNCFTGSSLRDCGSGYVCSQLSGCDYWYAGCGIWYTEPCNGYCS